MSPRPRTRVRLTGHRSLFDRFAGTVTRYTGSPLAFILATAVVVGWACTGPLFGFSDTWQIVINTGTTIVTFLMVFLIQQSQNKDSRAIHIKLNELIAAQAKASNRLVSIEDLDEDDLDTLHAYYAHLAKLARKNGEIDETHSLGMAKAAHASKHGHGSAASSAASAATPPSRRRRRKPATTPKT